VYVSAVVLLYSWLYTAAVVVVAAAATLPLLCVVLSKLRPPPIEKGKQRNSNRSH